MEEEGSRGVGTVQVEGVEREEERGWRRLVGLATSLMPLERLERMFTLHGQLVARRPGRVLAACLLTTALASTGLLTFHQVTHTHTTCNPCKHKADGAPP